MKRIAIVLGSIAALSLSVSTAFAQGSHPDPAAQS